MAAGSSRAMRARRIAGQGLGPSNGPGRRYRVGARRRRARGAGLLRRERGGGGGEQRRAERAGAAA
jgi:hypothetical protein